MGVSEIAGLVDSHDNLKLEWSLLNVPALKLARRLSGSMLSLSASSVVCFI